ncbi:recombinase family protein [Amycolatopsis sp. NPDC059027]|uniref:recombinase family protein n=1 Tax=Amycolatopsis sp. NPDC059027 TaxID=3346709 RepID=UPI00366F134E
MNAPRLRILAAIRLSRLTDSSTSPERQREVVQRWAQVHEGDIVDEAVDLGVSGSVDPFEREGLGPWLTDRPPEEWDVLVAWRLDRISRSAKDTVLLLEWLQQRGKRLVTIDDGLDSKSSMGRAFVQLAGVFAELERNTIQERVMDGRAALKAAGRWGGQSVPYGYRPVELEDGGWKLEVDPETSKRVQDMYNWVVEGQTVAEICRGLNDSGIDTPRDHLRKLRKKRPRAGKWNDQSIQQILTSRTYIGLGGSDVKGIIDFVTFNRVQAELRRRRRSKTRNPRSNSAPLSGVVLCGECLNPLWYRAQHVRAGQGRQKTETTYRYYYCKTKGHTKQIRAELLEESALATFQLEHGSEPVVDEIEIPDESAFQLAAVRAELDGVTEALKDADVKDRGALRARRTELENQQDGIENRPRKGPQVKRIDTGRTWGDWIFDLDPDGRRRAWLDHSFRFCVRARTGSSDIDLWSIDFKKTG